MVFQLLLPAASYARNVTVLIPVSSGTVTDHRIVPVAVPEPDAENQPRRPVLDPEAVLDFFRRLNTDPNPDRRGFQYVLALMLWAIRTHPNVECSEAFQIADGPTLSLPTSSPGHHLGARGR